MNEGIYIAHHGIIGQKWGIRRYQNSDGSLTDLGRRRYLNYDGQLNEKGKKYFSKHGVKPLDIMSPEELQEKLNSARMVDEYKKLMGSTVSEISKPDTKRHFMIESLRNAFTNSLTNITNKASTELFERMDGTHAKKVAENKASVENAKMRILNDSLQSKKLNAQHELYDNKNYKDYANSVTELQKEAEIYKELYNTTLAKQTYMDLIKQYK